ncbi:prepilin peptidase [Psychrobium sp. nBUS_13]|uniref:prepilin peptidase n=1 Tax=Psychrobium sp. nBUS_13 TaxID=3395319 RepID=UPI003EBD6D34
MNQFISLLQQEPMYFYGLVFLFSLLIGSFLNVVIHRLPIMMERAFKNEAKEYFSMDNVSSPLEKNTNNDPFNLAVPRSACPQCNHQITAVENIPVISYLFLKGKCRGCKTSISMRYPFVELVTGLLSMAVALKFGVSWQALAAIAFTWSLVALTFIDFDTMLLPDSIVLPVLWLGLFANSAMLFTDLNSAFFGAVAGYLSLWAVYWSFKLLTGKEGMGYGDFKLFALIGAWLGWQYLPLTIILSSAVGAVIGIALMLNRDNKRNIAIPFGPYLSIAGWIALMWGEQINNAYLRYMGYTVL